jgi:tRNA G18 (ribose-2'-O)-methylase SpoU
MRKLKNIELNRLSIDEFKKVRKIPLVIILDNIRSMNNIGSIFRTCDAFLVESLFLCGYTATPPHRDIHKTALGATESVNWKYFKFAENAINSLVHLNYQIISCEQTDHSILLPDFKTHENQKYALVFGNEVNGVEQSIIEMSNSCIEIPQSGTKHSLNIAVSAGIIIWEFYKMLNKR